MKAGFLDKYGALTALVVLFLVGAIWQPAVFLQVENLRNLLNQNAGIGIVAVGMTLVIAAGGIDLSVGSLLMLASALGMTVMNRMIGGGTAEGQAVLAGAAICVFAGVAMGLANGLLVTWGRIAPFVATLGGLVAYRSFGLALADGGEIRSMSSNAYPALGQGGIPLPFQTSGGASLMVYWAIFLFLVSAALLQFVVNRTAFGRHLIAVGGNERAAAYSAIAVGKVKLAAFTILGGLTGLAAIFASARTNAVSTGQDGMFWELDAIAAVVIGGTSLNGGHARVWGTVVGVLILGIINNMLAVSGVSVYWQGVVKGALILLAVLIQRPRTAS